jgi:hypothetical protein
MSLPQISEIKDFKKRRITSRNSKNKKRIIWFTF